MKYTTVIVISLILVLATVFSIAQVQTTKTLPTTVNQTVKDNLGNSIPNMTCKPEIRDNSARAYCCYANKCEWRTLYSDYLEESKYCKTYDKINTSKCTVYANYGIESFIDTNIQKTTTEMLIAENKKLERQEGIISQERIVVIKGK